MTAERNLPESLVFHGSVGFGGVCGLGELVTSVAMLSGVGELKAPGSLVLRLSSLKSLSLG